MSRYARAVSIDYENRVDEVPVVSAIGEHEIADLMVKYARRYGVPVVERAETARALQLLEEGESVPELLFRAVASILVEVDRILARTL